MPGDQFRIPERDITGRIVQGAPGPIRLPEGDHRPEWTYIYADHLPVGPWAHRFPISGTEIIVTPVNNLPQICALGAETEMVSGVGDLTVPDPSVLNPAGNGVLYAGPGSFQFPLGVAVGAGQIQIHFFAAGLTIPSGLPVNIELTFTIPFGGGGPGVINIPLPAIVAGVFPAAPGEVLVSFVGGVPVPADFVITAAGAVIGQALQPCPNYPSLWGIIYLDDAMGSWHQWFVAPGIPGGSMARRAVGISTFHPVRIVEPFREFTLTRAANQGWEQELIIQVRHTDYEARVT